MNNQIVEVGQVWISKSEFVAEMVLKTSPKGLWTIDKKFDYDEFVDNHTLFRNADSFPYQEKKNIITPTNSLKNSNRPPLGGWAAGNYECKCIQCEEHFTGDKRAVQCSDCAYKSEDRITRLEEIVSDREDKMSCLLHELDRHQSRNLYEYNDWFDEFGNVRLGKYS